MIGLSLATVISPTGRTDTGLYRPVRVGTTAALGRIRSGSSLGLPTRSLRARVALCRLRQKEIQQISSITALPTHASVGTEA